MRTSKACQVFLVCSLPTLCAAFPAAALDDLDLRIPPLYNSLIPPTIGGTYSDPVFGVGIKRLSSAPDTHNNAVSGQLLFVSTEYPTASPFNSDNTLLILQHQGYFGLYDGEGNYLKDLPFVVNAATEPRWSRTDPNVLYYVNGNALMRLFVPANTSSLVHSFSEYSAIRGRGESDISRDGDHFVFAGDEKPGPSGPGLVNRYVFVYEISTDTKGPVLDTAGHAFNSIYIAPDNSVAIGWVPTGTGRFTGVELFDRDMVFKRQLTHAIGHMHLTRDTNGEDVLVWTNSNDGQPIACQNGIVKVRLSDARQTCLLQLDWSLAVHITAPDGNGWAFVETYDPSPAQSVAGWKTYTNEILQVRLDGLETRRLLHHRSRQTASYGYQPRATVSRDGTRLVFTSNHGLQATLGHATGYTDAYLVMVPSLSLPPPATSDADLDSIPDGVELKEGTDPLTKDNDIFSNPRFFAMQQYRDFLRREGDQGGINYWAGAIGGGASRASVTRAFFDSNEFQSSTAPVARLYFAYFNRIPDKPGLDYWIAQYRAGTPLTVISQAFAGSPEFQATYGSLADAQFVSRVYANVLGRAPDAAGLAFWTERLASGAMTRGEVMLGFSESAENGLRSYNRIFVTMIYYGMLRRVPEPSGFDYWVENLGAGVPTLNLINAFLLAPEYRARFLP